MLKKSWPWLLGAVGSLTFPYLGKLLYDFSPTLSLISFPNWFFYVIVCGNVHTGWEGIRGVLSKATAFLVPALAYGLAFLLIDKLGRRLLGNGRLARR